MKSSLPLKSMLVSPLQRKLHIKYHGRILDQLGLQTYQSPTACLSELIANSWDADADEVRITLPKKLDQDAVLILKDDGNGMTFDSCENKYLNVGWCWRGKSPVEFSLKKHRTILGRKGIGKFAGYGIANVIHVETVSETTGEKTVFELDIDKLRGDEYVEHNGEIDGLFFAKDEGMRKSKGTTIILKSLTLQRLIPSTQFAKSLARRFLLHQRAADFKIYVDDQAIPTDEDLSSVEFMFPRDYDIAQRPAGLTIDEQNWGTETLSNGKT